MKTAATIVRSILRTGAFAAIAFLLVSVAQAYEATIPAPNGVGDVVALTNALTELNAVLASEGGKIWLEPGVYDLRGTYMNAKSHLYIVHTGPSKSLVFAGKGSMPGDTVLIGGGEAEKHRVIEAGGGGNSGWATFSNLTVTCGYVEGDGGGGIKANHSSRYYDMVISNNYATSSGGGCYGGQAYRCLFAGNRVGTANNKAGGSGAFYAAVNNGICGQKGFEVSGAWDCVFTNNTVLGNSSGGALVLRGLCQRCTFYDNSIDGSGGGGIGIVASTVTSWNGTVYNMLVTDCTFVRNTGRYGGGVYGPGCGISNCTFVCNREDCTWETTGGGAVCAISSARILDCVFEGNGGALSPGGAIVLTKGGEVSNCSFVTNSTPRSGGAIHSKDNAEFAVVSSCTFIGNVATNNGGAINGYVAVTNCSFVENSALTGRGGAISMDSLPSGAAISGCAFTNNAATTMGGALYVPGGVTNCTFVGNSALSGGGAIYANARSVAGFESCLFVSNHLSASTWAHGGSVRGASGVRPQMRNCTLTGNDAPYGYGAAAYYTDLYNCTVTNHVSSNSTLYGCNMTGCILGHNTISGNAVTVDYAEAAAPCTNINCLIISNSHPAIGHICVNKVNINCSYIGNTIGNINYGDIIRYCPSYNCLFAGNRVGAYARDIKTWYQDDSKFPLALTNCVFTASDMEIDYEGLHNCRKIANMRFADEANGDYTPTTRSPAYDAGCNEPWLLSLVGDKDLAGNPRVFGAGIDIGAYECQKPKPGAMMIVK